MRKVTVVYVITALCLFVSASPWEGAAVVAPEGELPGNGQYVATNSFPKNTVVDIVNIETNKSTRVIVANNLDSPGLLAIVSRSAAELIGMRAGSVSRIRMTQPTDPVAYARFTEGLSSGFPDYDSGKVITEESYDEGFVNPAAKSNRAVEYDYDDYTAPPRPAEYDDYPPPPPVNTPSYASAPDTGYPSYVLEPEWSGTNSARNIVDLPNYTDTYTNTERTEKIEEPELIAETETAEMEKAKEVEEVYEEVAEYFEEEEAEAVAEAEDETVEVFDYYEIDYYEPEEVADVSPDDVSPAEYNIVPAEDRPPMNIYGIDPALIIPGISNAPQQSTANNEPNFSIPRIYELSRGSYYVQLAAFDTAESVENSVSRIDQHYKPVVYKDGERWYRVLLGPLNQGESAAVLARFKSIGYKDAFVRLAR
ncbi:MAG: SPOR domain-containing protein [Treponema sp.]|jgi:cell division septation protein DedD|nr:SPOR domain-containing protein [Treponema sp.]